ncbi:MAG: hypothetical protein K6F33_13730 [Bacteroidales bacterium]|nr:hypothetical protein [Bacteroidales bacterium]
MTGTKTIIIASTLHFMVDAMCICCLYLTTHEISNYVIYNVLAFLTQPFTGIIIDKAKHRDNILLASALLLGLAAILALLLSQTSTFVIAMVLGIGNSLFHVWGGKEVATSTRNDIRALGIFVAPGAFGLAVGAVLASWALLYALSAAICLLSTYQYCNVGNAQDLTDDKPRPKYWIPIVGGIMLFVMFRSYVGGNLSANPSHANATILMAGAVAMLGKALGGFVSHNRHIAKVFVATTILAVACMWMDGDNRTAALVGLFLINCTMPITLYWTNKLAGKKMYGLSFGLLAASLVPPYLMAVL